ncbi:hypothetical protein PIB30_051757 [Stylosanthes scabra]|uniref:NAC domain-containing protein n=1 Tax=Stylosanthes scabra TaxID=79078 RepID=A0ABU6VG38_9FABA|nr:hypothetical protein [Stylosanthes scabra]
MEERNNNNNNDGEKVGDEVMLPGFRFHPTDEELVGFYLRRKIQQRPLSIELIKQLDIYKYDPWDLPKLASTGEKEWYFYCPRDRKYRNSARPNRVTGAGFWKATGTDRPIYSSSSEGSSSSSKCIIGLKKSLVFYKGRAAKGVKTDWMMHEFRLPSHHSSSSSLLSQNNKYLDNTIIPPNESWAICRIFKKTNSTSAQRALSRSWVSSLLPTAEPTTPDHNNNNIQTKDNNNPQEIINTQFCSSTTTNIIPLTKKPNCCIDVISNHFCPLLDVTSASYNSIVNPLIYYKALDHFYLPFSSSSNGRDHISNNNSFMFSSSDNGSSTSNTNFIGGLPQIGMHQFYDDTNNDAMVKLNNNNNNVHSGVDEQDLETLRSFGFPFGVPLNIAGEAWKSNYNNVYWDASSCPSYSTTKCYT